MVVGMAVIGVGLAGYARATATKGGLADALDGAPDTVHGSRARPADE